MNGRNERAIPFKNSLLVLRIMICSFSTDGVIYIRGYIISEEKFWVYRLKKAGDVRVRLVRRIFREEDDLSWHVEDDGEDVNWN